LKYFKTSLSAC